MELRQKANRELFALYDGELAFHHRSARGIHEAKRILRHFHNYLGEYPPTPELAKSFLSTFSNRKPTTIARYAAILKVFFKWYGEELDINIRVPKMLPSYVEKTDIEKLLEALKSKKSHRNTIGRDILLVDLAIHTGLRRSELASLRVGDIDIERQLLVVRQGKGSKDWVIPLSGNMSAKLAAYIGDKGKEDSLFCLAPATISGKIKTFARKAGVDIHIHNLRDYCATSLSEKGASIREIQSLLGHANLTHTERYTLHTDKHLRTAIEQLDTALMHEGETQDDSALRTRDQLDVSQPEKESLASSRLREKHWVDLSEVARKLVNNLHLVRRYELLSEEILSEIVLSKEDAEKLLRYSLLHLVLTIQMRSITMLTFAIWRSTIRIRSRLRRCGNEIGAPEPLR